MMKTWMRWGTCAVAVGLSLVPMTGRAGEDEKPTGGPEARRTLVLVQPLSGSFGQVGASVEQVVGRVGYTAIVSPGLTVQVGAGLAVQGSRNSVFTPKVTTPGDVPLGGLGLVGLPSRSGSVAPRMTVALGWAL
jgi:hypothetical protein